MVIKSVFLSLIMLASIFADVVHLESLADYEREVAKSDIPVVIDFFATWCGPCKMVGPRVEEVAKERQDVKIVKVDVDKAKELTENHKVRSMPTFVVVHKGKEIGRFTGAHEKKALHQKIDDIVKKTSSANAPAKKPEASKSPEAAKPQKAPEMPEPSKEEMFMQQLMSSLMTGNLEAAKQSLNKDNINFVIATPEMDLSPLWLIILSESDDVLNHALNNLKPDLKKVLNINGKKQPISKHLEDMANEARKQAERYDKLAKKLA